jgi:phage terminase large subunit-like protein
MSEPSSDGQFWFDEHAADLACAFFEKYLVHVKGEWAGNPFMLEAWQRDGIIRPLFGWKRKDSADPKKCSRRYRTAYIFVPRKCGKSTIAAGIALYLLFADHENGAEVYSAAADREQAAIVFEVAKQMVAANPSLVKRSETFKRAITVSSTGSSYKVLSADAYTKHGLNAHGIVFDELHAQPNRELWDTLTTSTGARRQPLVVAITTAGYDRNSICWELHSYAKRVAEGSVTDPSFLPVLYGLEDEEDWTSPINWAKANPSLGVSLKREYLDQEFRKAKEIPAYENTFRRLHLNQWTEQDSRWISSDLWDSCDSAVESSALKGKRCFAGLDLASTTDITALTLLFPHEDGTYDVLPFFWIPGENIALRERRDRVPYSAWARERVVYTTPGNVVDYEFIRSKIRELAELYQISEVVIDRWNATQLTTQLMGDGLTVVPWGQGYSSQSAPTKELMNLLMAGRIRHGGNPVLRWMASNVAVEQDAAGNMKPSRRRSTERIDGVVALINALGRASTSPVGQESVYNTRGIICI